MAVALAAATIAQAGTTADNPNFDGFAPPGQNLFYPLLRLASPGHGHAALDTFDTIMNFERKLVLHPAVSPDLQALIDKLPPPETITIEVPTLYADAAIPWQTRPPDVHYLDLSGRPDEAGYVYSLSRTDDPLRQPGRSAGTISIRPGHSEDAAIPETVIAEIQTSLHPPGSSLPSQGIAACADLQREIYGSLSPPWDAAPGQFNQHDRAAIARFSRDLPGLWGLAGHYLQIHNLVDEFDDASGSWVLFNLDAEIRDDALAPYPYLHTFYRDFISRTEAKLMVSDDLGRHWLRVGFNRGRITVTFLLRRGMLTPMDDKLRPDGSPLLIEQLAKGHFHTDSSVAAERFGLRFGLDRIRYATTYTNHDGAVEFRIRMAAVPRLIAPPIVHGLTMLIAGQFMQTLAQGNSGRGIATSYSARPDPQGGTILHGTFSGEFRNAPALAMLVRLAGAVTPAHDAEVRADESRLFDQFFDALASDVARARPILLSGGHIPH
ncbi:MAG: hypothetical protein ACLQU2_19310 [Candidatus Binataceae bacterium]